MGNGDRQHKVRLVGDDELPTDKDFVFIEDGDTLWLAVKVSRLNPMVLEDAWASYIDMGRMEQAGHVPAPGCCPLVGHRQVRVS